MLTRCSITLQFINWNAQVHPSNLLTNYPPKPKASKQHSYAVRDDSSSFIDLGFSSFFSPCSYMERIFLQSFQKQKCRHRDCITKDVGEVYKGRESVKSQIILCDVHDIWGDPFTPQREHKVMSKLKQMERSSCVKPSSWQRLSEHVLRQAKHWEDTNE